MNQQQDFQILDLSNEPKIKVVIRKRPINKKELGKSEIDIVDVRSGNSVIVKEMKQKVDLTKYVEEHQFNFDHSFNETCSNEQVYMTCVRPIVQAAFQRAKVTCFAYGQTGSGKTHTMMGNMQNRIPGMYVLASHDIFSAVKHSEFSHLQVVVSFYEIYCGKLFDLLNERTILHPREDAKQNINIVGLTEQRVVNVEQLLKIIEFGISGRITASNSVNADSSRSHAILQIQLKEQNNVYGKISFIDLAGSERGADVIDMNKQTMKDSAEINKSLLALKECIRALDQGKNYTPFRGSKLTLVLKDSFTGNCRTVMIGNISPSSGSSEDTLNTLRYADRVKELKKPTTGELSEQVNHLDSLARQLMLPRQQKNVVRKPVAETNANGNNENIPTSNQKLEQLMKQTGNNPHGLSQQYNLPNAGNAFQNNNNNTPYQQQQQQQYMQQNIYQQQQVPQQLMQSPPMQQQQQFQPFQQQSQQPIRQNFNNFVEPTALNPNNYALNVNNNNNNNNNGNNIFGKQNDMFDMEPRQLNKTPQQLPLSKGQSNNNFSSPAQPLQRVQNINNPNNGRQNVSVTVNQNAINANTNPVNLNIQQIESWTARNEEDLQVISQKHEQLIGIILAEEEDVIASHRSHIDDMVELTKQEMMLLHDVDNPQSDVDQYVQNLDAILQHKSDIINQLRQRLQTFQSHLRKEEILSKKFYEQRAQIMDVFDLNSNGINQYNNNNSNNQMIDEMQLLDDLTDIYDR